MELDMEKAVTENKQDTTAPSLLPHNEPAYDELEYMLGESNKAIVVSAMGTGKSYIAAKYIAEHGEKAVVVCPNRSVQKSWDSLVPGIDTMTYQYLCRMKPEDVLALPYTCWVFDEAHHCGAKEWQKNIDVLMENADGRKFIGLTADPVRHTDGGRDVSQEIFGGNVVDGLDLHEAIQKSVLPSFTYVSAVFGLEKSMDEAKNKAESPGPNRYLLAEKITKLEDSLKNRYKICEILDKHMPSGTRKGVVFVDHIDSLPEAMDIMREWAGSDVQFLTMHSQQSTKKNNAVMEKFQAMDEGYVFAIDMLNEGLHFPGVNTVIMFRHTESPTVFFQQIGRGLAANGASPIIFDFVGNRKSLATKSMTGGQGFLTGNSAERKHQSNIIIYDYANEALDLLDEINELLNGKWTEEEMDILRMYYPEEGSKVAKRLPGRSPTACNLRAEMLGIQYLPKSWSEEEINTLRVYYPEEGSKVAKRLPGRSPTACIARACMLGIQYLPKSWSEEEINTLRMYYPEEGQKVAKRLPGRTPKACKTMAGKCNISCVPKSWTEEEINILRKYYPTEGNYVAERLPGRTSTACWNMVVKLGIKRANYAWTKEEIDILRKYYPGEGKQVVKRLPGRSPSACLARARKLNIKYLPDSWTEEETNILKIYFPKEGKHVVKRLPGKSIRACEDMAAKIGIRGLRSPWTEKEIGILKEYYPSEGKQVAKRLNGRSVRSCQVKAADLGLYASSPLKRWNEAEITILKQYYPKEGLKVADRLPGRTTGACTAKACELGLSYQSTK